MSKVSLTSAVKKYGEVKVIHGLDLDIAPGEFCVFVGPSGCGKSTLLRMIAGLEPVSAGKISIGDRDVTHVEPGKRGVAMVFQSYALYPHMTVRENMSFGLRMSGVKREVIAAKVEEAARVLRLGEYLDRRPKALSGGQRQRVAIGRAIVRQPEVFLFDEPLSNLDAELRVQMRLEIARLHRDLGATMVYVTHDQVEAMTLADKIVVLRDGVIEQVGAPTELYQNPNNAFVAQFIGSPKMNVFAGVVQREGEHRVVVLDHSSSTKIPAPASASDGQNVLVGVRPEAFEEGAAITLELDIDVVENLGGVSYAYATLPGREEPVCIEMRGNALHNTKRLVVAFAESNALFFDAASGARLR